jgi:hypothetical protein
MEPLLETPTKGDRLFPIMEAETIETSREVEDRILAFQR